jgi:ring-1,2-phenylacetyl-CoA epoxidase subunit PaaD
VVERRDILAVLQTIPDPELPISIVDLGLVKEITLESRPGSNPGADVSVELLPTFIGCPALDMIAGDVRARLSALPGVGNVEVNWAFHPPWSVDRITSDGRAALAAHGVAVPERGTRLHAPAHEAPQSVMIRTSDVPCPFCGSSSTYLESPFGPTRCRTIHYCESCRNSFERMKSLA